MKKSVVVFVLLLCFLSIGFTDLRCSFEKYNFKITNFGNILENYIVLDSKNNIFIKNANLTKNEISYLINQTKLSHNVNTIHFNETSQTLNISIRGSCGGIGKYSIYLFDKKNYTLVGVIDLQKYIKNLTDPMDCFDIDAVFLANITTNKNNVSLNVYKLNVSSCSHVSDFYHDYRRPEDHSEHLENYLIIPIIAIILIGLIILFKKKKII